MENQVSKAIPFTEDATNHALKEYMDFMEVAYAPILCEQQLEEKSDKIQLVTEPTEEGEGKIDRKDVYKFIQDVLVKEQPVSPSSSLQDLERHKDKRCGYWAVGGLASLHEEKTDSGRDGDADDSQEKGRSLPVFQYGTLGLEVYPRDNDTIKLGTWDLWHMLQACLLCKPGQKIMPKLSGSASYEGTKKFRWSLRGPTIEPGSEAGSGGKRALKKFKTLFQK